MELVTKTAGDVLVVGIAQPGTLEATNVGDFREAMSRLPKDSTKLVIDMANVTFLDSSGLGAFIKIWRDFTGKSGEMKLCRLDPAVRSVFDLTRLSRVFQIYDTEAEALASYRDR